ncbi:30S ribosomal protein S16 [Patescibacteria group bacterium]|nr:30S ribosomal protein S16 [Patescibacteria group bacterium]
MLKIRLSRTGRKNYPSYRIVVTEASRKRDGKVTETIGHYNLQTDPPQIKIKKERLEYWIAKGAQMTDAVRKLSS